MAAADSISLARGAPSLDIVAVDDLRAAADRAFAQDPGGAFSYGTSAGYLPLVDWIAQRQQVAPEQVIATNGSMQADAFLFQALVEPGDVVVVEAPTYDRTLLALRQMGAELLAIPLEADGIDVDALEQALAAGARPKLAHIIPNFHNPAGCTLSLEKRRRLLELADRHDFVVFEDDPYVELRFEGEQLPTMLSLDERERVVYASSFSKTVCPGIRVGYLAGPAELIAADAQAGHQHLHLAEHGLPVDRGRVLPLGRHRPLDRDREGRSAGAPRRVVRGAASAICPTRGSSCPRAATSCGSTFPREPTSPVSPSSPASGASCSSRARTSCSRAARARFRIAYSGVSAELIDDAIARLAGAYRDLAGAAA